MAISQSVREAMESSSWIRKMFEAGDAMRRAGKPVFDLSLGNPDLPPPESFYDALAAEASLRRPGIHGYMPNAGLEGTRSAVASRASELQGTDLSAGDIVMTCGAGGALNVVLKALLNPGDKVLVSAPYFVEYRFYAANHGGVLVVVPTKDDFDLDLGAIDAALDGVAAVIINSPNNPSGRVYPETTIRALGELLERRSVDRRSPIYLISDEPYRGVTFDNVTVPPVLAAYPNSIVCTSYSKELSLAAERIGYIAVNPGARDHDDLVGAAVLANRILGFVNAPGLMQRVLPHILGARVDIETYAARRTLLCDSLQEAGYEFLPPEGGLFLFPKAPGGDDVAFVYKLQEQGILAVPGSGFGSPGYFRLAFCVDTSVIEGALPGFRLAR
ncbi:MAG: pyridoxal phosphate-dependent aminotransferase [Spirochaetaceae bacterium]